MSLPQDPIILYSFLNTQLRDHYTSLDEFCRANCCDEKELVEKLSAVGFEYDREKNRFA
ncbi:MAG: DUF4250 domain-containing protein [Acutalibacteraceae bacterium]|nr:DUF4250 domain-containing protein [Clostridia bacterium]MEE3402683.1 DUF4250 domain-containing protein [Acutalibacteraceae bacterium]HCA54797.1 DUF4250 domain-containing protein [Oscillospiraceae bacterium]